MGRVRALIALSLVACGNPLGPEQFRKDYAAALCSFYSRCEVIPDEKKCTQLYSQADPQQDADLASGKVTFSGQSAFDCIAVLPSVGCNLEDQTRAFGENSACQRAFFSGTVQEGGACTSSAQCVSQSCDTSNCNADDICCQGKCGAPRAMGVCNADADCPMPLTQFCDKNSKSCRVGSPGTELEFAL